MHLSKQSIGRYGLAISEDIKKKTTSAMKSIVSASIMFDEASDITMNKKLNIFINV